jgi:hypothetical protein
MLGGIITHEQISRGIIMAAGVRAGRREPAVDGAGIQSGDG